MACAEFCRKVTEKSAGKKQPTQPTPDIKRKKMKKPELIGLKLIGLSGWNILFLNHLYRVLNDRTEPTS